MTDPGREPSRIYRWGVARALPRVRHLLDPEEEVQAAAILQRGLKPLRAFVLMGVGAAIFTPALTSPELLVPDAVRWYVGIPIFVAGALLNAIPGQALLVLTAGTAYVISRPALPGMRPRRLGMAPADTLELDLERGIATVAGQRLWALPFNRSSLRALTAGGPGSPPPAQAPRGAARRWGARLAALIGLLIVLGVVLDALIETDAEEIERVILEYNNGVARGDGEAACAALTRRARAEVVVDATAALFRPVEPPTCRRAVESVADQSRDAVSVPEVGEVPVVGIEVEGDRATARVGLPFAFQPIPMIRTGEGWRRVTIRTAAVVRDAPADDPPSATDFAVRAEGLCRNGRLRYVPPAARLVALPDPVAEPDVARPVADLLEEISSGDRMLAAELSLLTPPPGMRADVQRIVGTLRTVADVRDAYAAALVAGRPEAITRVGRSVEQARTRTLAAARDAGLERTLGSCL